MRVFIYVIGALIAVGVIREIYGRIQVRRLRTRVQKMFPDPEQRKVFVSDLAKASREADRIFGKGKAVHAQRVRYMMDRMGRKTSVK